MKEPTPTSYDIDPLLATRWSPRTFAPKLVDGMTLRRLLEAARWAPSCFNAQPWRFLVGRREDAEGFAAILRCLVEKNQGWAKDAPVLMVSVCAERFARNERPNRWGAHDVGLAMSQLTLQATQLGLVTHQMGGFDADRARRDLRIPDGFTPIAVTALGYPHEAAHPTGRRRLAHDALFFGATWGDALTTDADYERVLDHWFGTLDGDGLADGAHTGSWWKKDPAFDAALRDRFEATLHAVLAGERAAWLATPRGRLAAIITLDQFSRNLYRDTPRMYAADAQALSLTLDGLAAGDHEALLADEQAFMVMPLMHSETLAHQERSVALFEAMVDAAPSDGARAKLTNNLRFAIAHRDIVLRFGRFPHRNAILGRESTAEEQAFLTQPGSSF